MVKNSFQLGNILEKENKQKILLWSIIDIMIGLAKDVDNGWIVYYSCFDIWLINLFLPVLQIYYASLFLHIICSEPKGP